MENSDNPKKECIQTKIWDEEAEADNPYAAAVCYCAGYDVYGDLLGKIRWPEYLYLLTKQERPAEHQSKLLESLAVCLANPGPRDYSVRAAMSAAAGGATAASCLMSALAVGAGQFGGAREVYLAVDAWNACNRDLDKWKDRLQNPASGKTDATVWPAIEHPPGFDPYGVRCATPVRQALSHLAGIHGSGALGWLEHNRLELEKSAEYPLAMTGVAAATLVDLGLGAREAEMLYLLLRLPGAAAHALEQHLQWKKYPFFKDELELTNDPGPKKEADK
ncbi:MAG TPA: citryl-CoA lyase [Gammaproteobacteria bacterium]